MRRSIQVLRKSDPARDLGLTLDERAEAELDSLVGAAAAENHRTRDRLVVRSKVQPAIVTGLVAAVVAAAAIPLLLHAPARGRTAASDDRSRGTATAIPVTAPLATSAPSLVAPDGWRPRTRAELHAFVVRDSMLQEDPSNAAIWEEQAWLDMQCMAEKGYLYDPIGEQAANDRKQSGDPAAAGLSEEQQQGYQLAFWGKNTAVPYDWHDAGCHGRSVHLTGQDNAH